MTDTLYCVSPVSKVIEKNTTLYPEVALKIFHSHVKSSAAIYFKLQKATQARDEISTALLEHSLPEKLVKQYGKMLLKPEEASARTALVQAVTNTLDTKIQAEVTTLTAEYNARRNTLTTEIQKYYSTFQWNFNYDIFVTTFDISLQKQIELYKFKQDQDKIKKDAKILNFEAKRARLPSADTAAIVSEKELAALISRLTTLELTNKNLKAKKGTGIKAKRPNPAKAKNKGKPKTKGKKTDNSKGNGKKQNGLKNAI